MKAISVQQKLIQNNDCHQIHVLFSAVVAEVPAECIKIRALRRFIYQQSGKEYECRSYIDSTINNINIVAVLFQHNSSFQFGREKANLCK